MKRDRDWSRFLATLSRHLRYDGEVALTPADAHLIPTVGIPTRFPQSLLAVSPGIWLAQLRPGICRPVGREKKPGRDREEPCVGRAVSPGYQTEGFVERRTVFT
jgi:hypothetical protein